jgi:hypothetical protein
MLKLCANFTELYWHFYKFIFESKIFHRSSSFVSCVTLAENLSAKVLHIGSKYYDISVSQWVRSLSVT